MTKEDMKALQQNCRNVQHQIQAQTLHETPYQGLKNVAFTQKEIDTLTTIIDLILKDGDKLITGKEAKHR